MEEGETLPFDSLIVSSGATAKFFGIPGASELSFPLYTLTDARALRDHILRRLELADADPTPAAAGALTFVVVGGGPTGVEVAGALAELLDVAVSHDGFRFSREDTRIIMVDGVDRLLTTVQALILGLHGRHPPGPGHRTEAGPDGQVGHLHLRGARRRQ